MKLSYNKQALARDIVKLIFNYNYTIRIRFNPILSRTLIKMEEFRDNSNGNLRALIKEKHLTVKKYRQINKLILFLSLLFG